MKNLLFILCIFLFSSCAEEEPIRIPADILNQERMILIITDLQLADAGFRFSHYEKQDPTFDPKPFYDVIYKKHATSREEFERSLKFYTSEPDLLSDVYSGVLEQLLSKQAELGKTK